VQVTLHLRLEQRRVPPLAQQQNIISGQQREQLVDQISLVGTTDAVLGKHGELRVVDLVSIGREQHPTASGERLVYLPAHRREHGQAPVAGQVALPEEPVLHVHDHEKLSHRGHLRRMCSQVDKPRLNIYARWYDYARWFDIACRPRSGRI
jgi:hypothetical protein